MSAHFEKVKAYLLELEHEITHEDVVEELFIVQNQKKGLCNTIIDCEEDILIIEQHIMDTLGSEIVYKRLLQMNRSLVHGAFVLDDTAEKIIFRDTLQLANLDLNELEGSLNALALGLVENADELLTWAANDTANA